MVVFIFVLETAEASLRVWVSVLVLAVHAGSESRLSTNQLWFIVPLPCNIQYWIDLKPLIRLPLLVCFHNSLPLIFRALGIFVFALLMLAMSTEAAGSASACQASGANSFCTSAQLAQPSPRSCLDYGFIKVSYICDILTQMGYNKFHLNKQCLLCVINFAFSCPH